MHGWQNFFFGNIRRTLTTLGFVFVAISIAYPPLPIFLLNRFWMAFGALLTQLFQGALVLGIMFIGFRMIIRGRR